MGQVSYVRFNIKCAFVPQEGSSLFPDQQPSTSSINDKAGGASLMGDDGFGGSGAGGGDDGFGGGDGGGEFSSMLIFNTSNIKMILHPI